MKKEISFETKKSYTTPKMDVVELKHEVNLLVDSCEGVLCPDNPTEGG